MECLHACVSERVCDGLIQFIRFIWIYAVIATNMPNFAENKIYPFMDVQIALISRKKVMTSSPYKSFCFRDKHPVGVGEESILFNLFDIIQIQMRIGHLTCDLSYCVALFCAHWFASFQLFLNSNETFGGHCERTDTFQIECDDDEEKKTNCAMSTIKCISRPLCRLNFSTTCFKML